MKTIYLKSGQEIKVDDEDFEYLNQWKWYLAVNHYAARRDGKKYIYMHREIMNPPKGMVTDHVDNNGFNNQKSNLRICTRSQNSIGMKKIGTSRFKGVSWDKKKKKWEAHIKKDYRKYFLGYFAKELDAATKYNEVSKRLFGDFARPNLLV